MKSQVQGVRFSCWNRPVQVERLQIWNANGRRLERKSGRCLPSWTCGAKVTGSMSVPTSSDLGHGVYPYCGLECLPGEGETRLKRPRSPIVTQHADTTATRTLTLPTPPTPLTLTTSRAANSRARPIHDTHSDTRTLAHGYRYHPLLILALALAPLRVTSFSVVW